MCLPVTPWIFTQSTMPESGLERTIRVFWRSTIKYLKLPPNPRAGQRLIEFCQENTLVIANTLFQQHKRRLYTWTSPDGRHWNQIDYILCSQRWRSSIQSAKARPGVWDPRDLVAQNMNSLLPNSDWNWRKWGKPLGHSSMTKIKSLMIIQWKWEIDLRD